MVELALNVVAVCVMLIAVAFTISVMVAMYTSHAERAERRAAARAAGARTVEVRQRIDATRERMDAEFERDLDWVSDRLKRSPAQ